MTAPVTTVQGTESGPWATNRYSYRTDGTISGGFIHARQAVTQFQAARYCWWVQYIRKVGEQHTDMQKMPRRRRHGRVARLCGEE